MPQLRLLDVQLRRFPIEKRDQLREEAKAWRQWLIAHDREYKSDDAHYQDKCYDYYYNNEALLNPPPPPPPANHLNFSRNGENSGTIYAPVANATAANATVSLGSYLPVNHGPSMHASSTPAPPADGSWLDRALSAPRHSVMNPPGLGEETDQDEGTLASEEVENGSFSPQDGPFVEEEQEEDEEYNNAPPSPLELPYEVPPRPCLMVDISPLAAPSTAMASLRSIPLDMNLASEACNHVQLVLEDSFPSDVPRHELNGPMLGKKIREIEESRLLPAPLIKDLFYLAKVRGLMIHLKSLNRDKKFVNVNATREGFLEVVLRCLQLLVSFQENARLRAENSALRQEDNRLNNRRGTNGGSGANSGSRRNSHSRSPNSGGRGRGGSAYRGVRGNNHSRGPNRGGRGNNLSRGPNSGGRGNGRGPNNQGHGGGFSPSSMRTYDNQSTPRRTPRDSHENRSSNKRPRGDDSQAGNYSRRRAS